MNVFREDVHDQIELAEQLLWLHAEVEKKKRMKDLLQSLDIRESATHMTKQLHELQEQLQAVQNQFDVKMKDVIESLHPYLASTRK